MDWARLFQLMWNFIWRTPLRFPFLLAVGMALLHLYLVHSGHGTTPRRAAAIGWIGVLAAMIVACVWCIVIFSGDGPGEDILRIIGAIGILASTIGIFALRPNLADKQ
jgi:hypothetical protein